MERFEDYGIYGINMFGATEQRAVCPECKKRKGIDLKDRDLAVNIEKKVWECKSSNCGWSGVLKNESYTKEYKKEFIPKQVETKSKPVEESNADKLYKFFKSRKISKETVDRNNITYEIVYYAELKQETSAIAFPYYVEDKLVNVKYRTKEKKFQQIKGGQKVFFKLNDIKALDYCIITEGEIDALSFEEAGYKSAISVPDGAINPEVKNIQTKLEYLENCYTYLEHIKKYYIATDSDAPGIRLREELARRFGKSKCYLVRFPEDCKDANEVLIKHGKEYLQKSIEDAVPYPVEGYFKAEDKRDGMKALYKLGYPDGARTGWKKFDEKLRCYPSTINVITGIPSHGKSNWLDELMLRLSIFNGWKFGVFSSENGTTEIHLHRLCEILIGKPLLPNYNNRMTEQDMNNALDYINEHFFFIEPPENNNTMDNILETATYLVKKYGIKGLILDPWNTIDHELNKDNETEYIKKALNRLTHYEREHGLWLSIVAHPTKIPRIKGKKHYEVPTLYDINGSANWYNKTEIGISVYRKFNEDYSNTEYTGVYIQKVKHKFMGHTGMIKFHFETSCQRYYEEDSIRFEDSFLNYVRDEFTPEETIFENPRPHTEITEDIPF